MNFALIKYNEDNYFISISISIVLHSIIIFASIFIFDITVNNHHKTNPYVQVYTSEFENIKNTIPMVKEKHKDKPLPIKKVFKKEVEQNRIIEKKENQPNKNAVMFLNFSGTNADTTNLDQIYKEPTLDVSMRYPKGWTYIDQNVKDKLDGVTFWALKGNYDPPPYIHLEVKEKYLFNESRYKNRRPEKNYVIFYNDPVELSGQISQILYIRTEDDEDFSIKLIMNDVNSFKSFQPEFFGMIKTFKFGKQYF